MVSGEIQELIMSFGCEMVWFGGQLVRRFRIVKRNDSSNGTFHYVLVDYSLIFECQECYCICKKTQEKCHACGTPQ